MHSKPSTDRFSRKLINFGKLRSVKSTVDIGFYIFFLFPLLLRLRRCDDISSPSMHIFFHAQGYYSTMNAILSVINKPKNLSCYFFIRMLESQRLKSYLLYLIVQ